MKETSMTLAIQDIRGGVHFCLNKFLVKKAILQPQDIEPALTSELHSSGCNILNYSQVERNSLKVMLCKVKCTKCSCRGFTNTHLVDFAELTIAEQMQLAHCTKVLIGVQGAGLIWFVAQTYIVCSPNVGCSPEITSKPFTPESGLQ